MKRTLGYLFALSAVLGASAALAQEADLVLRNGIVWTVDENKPRAQAIAALRDKIVFVGSNAGVQDYIGSDTRIVDLDGRLVVPGFNDNHVHFESTGSLLYGLNLLDVSSESNFVSRIKDVHGRYAAGTWITGGDWSAYEAWAEGDVAEAGREVNPDDLYGDFFLPNRRMIDSFTRDRPGLV
ncbi:MAG: amidohydrolase family protein, partial [Gammaproteobacteria bacterium]|nr:amidohydrolase family protein [Gammaproteobacteria bacterium]